MHKLVAILVFVAILPLPYDYYSLLRIVVSLGCLYLLVAHWKILENHHRGILSVLIVLFNPLAPIFLSKLIWVLIDLVVGMYLIKLPLDVKKNMG
jgi:hypothetical protein